MTKTALDIRDPHATIPSLVQAAGTTPMGRFVFALSPALSIGIAALFPKGRGAAPLHWTTGERSTVWSGIQPSRETTREAVSAEIRVLKARATTVDVDRTLRGRWRGNIVCKDGVGHVTLTRKVATYSTIEITTDETNVVRWAVHREAKWFGAPTQKAGNATSVADAIKAAVAALTHVVGEACTVRDTQLRQARDPVYAAERPLAPAKAPRSDRVDRALSGPAARPAPPPRPPKAPKAVGGWTIILGDDDVPRTTELVKPTKAQLAAAKRGGLQHDPEAGEGLHVTLAPWRTYPAGALVHFGTEPNAGWHITTNPSPGEGGPPVRAVAPVASQPDFDDGGRYYSVGGDSVVMIPGDDGLNLAAARRWARRNFQHDDVEWRSPSKRATGPRARPVSGKDVGVRTGKGGSPTASMVDDDADPNKDKKLMDAFASAVQRAMGGR